MASISVAGDVSGAISIAAPSAAGSGVLTLPTGTDTLVGKATTDTLTNKSIAATQLTGTIAASVLPAGCVLQVVNATYSTTVTNATSTYADSGLTVSITPRSASSKILVEVFQSVFKGTSNSQGKFQLVRNATSIIEFEKGAPYTGTASANDIGAVGTTYLDSPATTSATTYKVQFAANAGTIALNDNNGFSTITAMEIQG